MDDELGRMTAAYEHGEMMQEQYEGRIRAMFGNSFRRFVLDRNVDVTGVSGTGVVAEGVEFSDGVCVLHWIGAWPSSVVHYDRGLDSVLHVHGHDGRTVVRFLDGPSAGVPREHSHEEHMADDAFWEQRTRQVHEHDDGTVHAHDHEGDHDHEH